MKSHSLLMPLLVYILAAIVVGCSTSGGAQTPSRPQPPPTPDPAQAIQNLRSRLASRADYDKLVIDEDVVAAYIPCSNPPAEWIAAIIIYHIPSVSEAYLNQDGFRSSVPPRYGSEEGRRRLEAVLGDNDLKERIVSKAKDPSRCQPG